MTAQISIAPEAPDEALVMAYDFVAVLSVWPPDHPPMVTCGLCGFGSYTWVVVVCEECGQPHYAPPAACRR